MISRLFKTGLKFGTRHRIIEQEIQIYPLDLVEEMLPVCSACVVTCRSSGLFAGVRLVPETAGN
jgi:hypothetical protein